MFRRTRHAVVIICLATLPVSLHAQRRGGRVPPNPPGHFAVRGHAVFVGGYFYDPHFGPYPWWGPGVYRMGPCPPMAFVRACACSRPRKRPPARRGHSRALPNLKPLDLPDTSKRFILSASFRFEIDSIVPAHLRQSIFSCLAG
jgi:hypothetical protein